MRLKLTLKTRGTDRITLNYHYPLSSAIYKLLHFRSPEFSEFLHSIGYKSNSRICKLFTFALRFKPSSVVGSHLKLLDPEEYLYISSPLIDDFINNFLIGTFIQKDLEIYGDFVKSCFSIEFAEYLPEPKFSGNVRIKLLSPLTLSTRKMENGSVKQYYFRPNDDLNEMQKVFTTNLINKYEAIYKEKYNGSGIVFSFDDEYIKYARRKNIRLTKKITVMKERENPIEIIGMQLPFMLEGCNKLIKTGYHCGFGEKNSMGFGFGEVENYWRYLH